MFYLQSFFVENGIGLFLWVGLQVDPNLLQQIFGVPTIGQVDIEMVSDYWLAGYDKRCYKTMNVVFSLT